MAQFGHIIVDFPIKNGDFPVRYVKLPEGKSLMRCTPVVKNKWG